MVRELVISVLVSRVLVTSVNSEVGGDSYQDQPGTHIAAWNGVLTLKWLLSRASRPSTSSPTTVESLRRGTPSLSLRAVACLHGPRRGCQPVR